MGIKRVGPLGEASLFKRLLSTPPQPTRAGMLFVPAQKLSLMEWVYSLSYDTLRYGFSLLKLKYWSFVYLQPYGWGSSLFPTYLGIMKNKYVSYWNQTFQQSQKLSFYCTIKDDYSPSPYLVLTRKNPSRKALVRFRISSHQLRIETGRYENIPRKMQWKDMSLLYK